MDHFIGGFAYGAATVIVGMPLDTIKTLQQTHIGQAGNMVTIGRRLAAEGGWKAFYRGGLPMFLGGGFMRSAQFGCNEVALSNIRKGMGGPTKPEGKLFGCLDPQIILAGFAGGLGRGVVEAPIEFLKVRRQVLTPWAMREIVKGAGTTLFRNAFLFSSFVVYVDVSKNFVELSPFWLGAICSNMAWMTIWPLDVVKSRLQSGKFKEGMSMRQALADSYRSGAMFRGLAPGLLRSFIANGVGMTVMVAVQKELKEMRREE